MRRGLKQGAKEGERDREARECGEGTARNESHANAVFDKRVPAVRPVREEGGELHRGFHRNRHSRRQS